jgi:hypothetical protein
MFYVKQLRTMNDEMLENMLHQHQTRNELLQTKLASVLEENRQLKITMTEEWQLAMDRYQVLRKMIVEHLEHCPLQEKFETSERPLVKPLTCSENEDPFACPHSSSTESTDSFVGIPESTFETEHPKQEYNHAEKFLRLPSKELTATKNPTDIQTASHLLLSLSDNHDEAQEPYDGFDG